ncbi:MAG TPA: O-antigen ligase family protein [Flavobacterium sp.]|nr:O-antigen ligase family protein [Flavobacterium sp.]
MRSFNSYFWMVITHVAIGTICYLVSAVAMALSVVIVVGGLIYIVKKQNKQHEALLVAAYITGAEVFLRAAHGVPFYEYGKYCVALVIGFGLYFNGFSKNATAYWIFLLLLIPGVILGNSVLSSSIENRKIISFVISGPLCLGLCTLYTYQRRVTLQQFYDILLAMALPAISLTVFVILFTPNLRDVLTGTGSTAATSGGFGPNQVSTILGLAMFIFVSRALLQSPDIRFIGLNLFVASVVAFRGINTFSRGGMITGIVMLLALLYGLYQQVRGITRVRILYAFGGIAMVGMFVWSYSLIKTDGLIGKRYANQDASGKVKESRLTGREEIAQMEIDAFLENPILGVGVGKTIDMREEESGTNTASHDEITRMLAEHGSLGIMMLLILIFTPIILRLDNKQNFMMFPLLIFWFLTINHSSMRIAASGFVYSLSLLKIQFPASLKPKPRRFPGMTNNPTS